MKVLETSMSASTRREAIRTIKVEARTVQEARDKVRAETPLRFSIHSETIHADERAKAIMETGATIAEASAKAEKRVPAGAIVLKRHELFSPERTMVLVDSFDVAGAREKAVAQAGKPFGIEAVVDALILTSPGSRGIFGLGRRADRYQATVLRPAIMELTYRTPACVTFVLWNVPLVLRERAIAWWAEPVRRPESCQFCGLSVQGGDGYVIDTADLLGSTIYLDYAVKEEYRRQFGDNWVIAAMDYSGTRAKVVGRLGHGSTQWLACDACGTKAIRERWVT